MELTGVGIVVFLVLLFEPALRSVLESIAFRNRAAGKAKMLQARGTSDTRPRRERRTEERGRRD